MEKTKEDERTAGNGNQGRHQRFWTAVEKSNEHQKGVN